MALCALLSYKIFPLNIKPWNCQVELSLFPPVFSTRKTSSETKHEIERITPPGIWNYNHFENLAKTFPSRRPMFTIVVADSNLFDTFNRLKAFQPIFDSFRQSHFSINPSRIVGSLANHIFMVFEVEPLKSKSYSAVNTDQYNAVVSNVIILHPNPSHNFGITIAARVSRGIWEIKATNLGNIIMLGLTEYHEWHIGALSVDSMGFSAKLRQYFDDCLELGNMSPRNILLLRAMELREACSIVYLWNSAVVRSCSANRCRERNGTHGKFYLQFEPSVRSISSKFTPVKYHSSILHLKFISCGGVTRWGKLQFSELISIFDGFTWTFMCLSGIFFLIADYVGFQMSPMIKVRQNKTFESPMVILSFVRIFLEQGNAIIKVNSIIRTQTRRMYLVGVLLAGIIICNAYKNTNVYNMVRPRAVIPVDTLDQLIKNEFRIFTRLLPDAPYILSSLDEFMWFFHVAKGTVTGERHEIKFQNKYFNTNTPVLLATSEIFAISNQLLANITKEERKFVDRLLNHSSLFPGTLEKLYGMVQLSDAKSTNKIPALSYFHHLENTMIKQTLEDCKKVAVVLPRTMCLEEVKRLLKINVSSKWYIGKESWFATDIGISLRGVVSKQVLDRIGYLGQSGIWQWLEVIPGETNGNLESGKGSNNGILSRPSMDGNILILFTVWLIGLGVALIKLIGEVGKVHFTQTVRNLTLWA